MPIGGNHTRKGMAEIAEAAGIGREALCKTLRPAARSRALKPLLVCSLLWG